MEAIVSVSVKTGLETENCSFGLGVGLTHYVYRSRFNLRSGHHPVLARTRASLNGVRYTGNYKFTFYLLTYLIN